MPRLTRSVIGLPVWPLKRPLRTDSENSRICWRTRLTSGMTSLPSTSIGWFERLRSAT